MISVTFVCEKIIDKSIKKKRSQESVPNKYLHKKSDSGREERGLLYLTFVQTVKSIHDSFYSLLGLTSGRRTSSIIAAPPLASRSRIPLQSSRHSVKHD